MLDFETNCMESYVQHAMFYENNKHYCAVCEREIHAGESCYCFEGEAVCEDCCNTFVIDRYWYASPNDIQAN